MSAGYIIAIVCVVFCLACLLIVFGPPHMFSRKRPIKVEVLETTSYDNDRGRAPSATMHLMWRLYPQEASRGNVIAHPGFIHAHVMMNKVLVFTVVKGQPYVFEDDPAIFPSDALITKIRLLAP